jgi:hypothetical protein
MTEVSDVEMNECGRLKELAENRSKIAGDLCQKSELDVSGIVKR